MWIRFHKFAVQCLVFTALAGPRAGAETPGLTSILRQETSTLATLESLTDWVSRNTEELEEARSREAQAERQIVEAKRRMSALEARSHERRFYVQQRSRSLYKLSRGGVIRLVLDAASGQELATRLSAASLILRRDIRELALYNEELRELATEKQALEMKLSLQASLHQRLEAKQKELESLKAKQVHLLRRLKLSRRMKQELQSELSTEQQRLLRRIKTLAWRVENAGGFVATRGDLLRPVPGPIVGTFGKIQDTERQVEIFRAGLTFRPPVKSAVQAAEKGIVRLAGPMRGYGNLVLLQHADGYYTLYGFLSRIQIAEGAEVDRGAVLGRSGLDPLTKTSATYFELRHHERPLDPTGWIRRSRAAAKKEEDRDGDQDH